MDKAKILEIIQRLEAGKNQAHEHTHQDLAFQYAEKSGILLGTIEVALIHLKSLIDKK